MDNIFFWREKQQDTDGIKMVQGEGFMVNGSTDYCDLQGRRVAQPTRGIYIINGKKIVIK